MIGAALMLSACGKPAPRDTCGIYPPTDGVPIDADTFHEVIDWAVTDLQLAPEFSHAQICEGLAHVDVIHVRDDLDSRGAFFVSGHWVYGLTSPNRPRGTVYLDISAREIYTSIVAHELAHVIQPPDYDPDHLNWESRGIQHAINVSAFDMH